MAKSTGSNKSLPFLAPSRILVIAGHFGSGKTEIALNLAIAMRPWEKKLALIDLDIVNPYFRTAEQEDLLRAHDIDLYKPIFAATSVDIPSLPPEIMGVFAREDLRVIFDVGGDDLGAAALGGYAPQFERSDRAFYMVVNPYRPRSETKAQIVEMYEAIARRARMRPDALVCNANLGDETTSDDLLAGYETVRVAAEELGVPVAFACARRALVEEMGAFPVPVFPIDRHLKPEWMER